MHLLSPIFTVCLSKTRNLFRFLQLTNFMLPLRKFWIISMVLFTSSIFAQYTGVINSNRPGFSESPYSVGSGVYQLETSFFYRKVDRLPTFSRPELTGTDLFFRTSFFKEKLELNLNFAYQRGQIAFQNIFNSHYNASGIRNLSIGAKYLVYEQEYTDKSKEVRSWKERHRFDWKRLIPSVAAYAGVNTGLGDNIFNLYDDGGFSPKVGVLLQNDITRDLNVVTNIFYDRIITNAPELSYIITATYSLDDRWSTFFENQTISNKYRVESNMGSGIAYLWNRNLQINTSLRLVADGRAKGYYASFGASYRLDRHADDFTEVDEFGNPIEDEEFSEEPKKKGFFGRIFGKATNLFKKKGKKTTTTPTELKEKTIESIRNNTNKDELTINNDTLQKAAPPKPIRTRPKRVRVRPTKYKPVKGDKKKKKGLFGGLFGGKTDKDKENAKKKKEADRIKKMSQKEIDRELRKLDKEQKKLEKQQKKEAERKKREEAKKKKDQEKKKDNEKKEGNG